MVYVHDRLVRVDLAITNLKIEMTIGVRTNPGLEVNSRALIAEIRKRHEISVAAAFALGETRSYFVHDFILSATNCTKSYSIFIK